MTELDIARAIAAGTLPSPTQYFNAQYFALRITGTGVAFRAQYGEFAFRDPRIWLTPEMVERARGMPVVWVHPEGDMLDTQEFANRVIGSITYAWVRGDELMGVARILDADAAALLRDGEWDTSPGVMYAADASKKLTIGADVILVEGVPALIDHLAIVAKGLWSKGRPDNAGVELTEQTQ